MLVPKPEFLSRPLDQVCRPLEIQTTKGVFNRVVNESVALVPQAGPMVKLWHQVWLSLAQPPAEQIGKEMVIPVPTPFFIQGYNE